MPRSIPHSSFIATENGSCNGARTPGFVGEVVLVAEKVWKAAGGCSCKRFAYARDASGFHVVPLVAWSSCILFEMANALGIAALRG